jgi:IS5 family transposase
MLSKKHPETIDMFRSRLDQVINLNHPLVKLANEIDWSFFENEYVDFYSEDQGRPSKTIRLLVGLHYLKHAFDESDESVVDRLLENPYWQYFCGFEYFEKEISIHFTMLTKFRRRIGPEGVEQMFKALIDTAVKTGALKAKDLRRVVVDTTVQEKAVTYPTDAKLYRKMCEVLTEDAKDRGIKLRQSYTRKGREALFRQGRYAHAGQYKRARRETRKLKTYLGRVVRDLRRKAVELDDELHRHLALADRLLAQEKHSKNKVYSIHAPEVECISKGKVHKRYEFGVKTGVTSTLHNSWILGIRTFKDNPYDGHTLTASLEQSERLTGEKIHEAYVDLGYRGHGHEGQTQVHVVDGRKMKRLTRHVRGLYKRRAAIEPIIGHLKNDNGMSKNWLKGEDGDMINALLSGCGYNMRKLLRFFFVPIFKWIKKCLSLDFCDDSIYSLILKCL